MLKYILLVAIISAATPAFAQTSASSDPTDAMAQAKIQIGQLFIALGSAELEVSKLKKELASEKAKDSAAPKSTPSPH